MSLYCHLIIYLFLPIAKKTVALITGTLVSLICLVIFIVVELKFVSKNILRSRKISFILMCIHSGILPKDLQDYCVVARSKFLGVFFPCVVTGCGCNTFSFFRGCGIMAKHNSSAIGSHIVVGNVGKHYRNLKDCVCREKMGSPCPGGVVFFGMTTVFVPLVEGHIGLLNVMLAPCCSYFLHFITSVSQYVFAKFS